MYNVCLTYAKDEDDAADALQEGFIKMFRNLKKFKHEGSFEGWLRKIIVNTALVQYRKKIKEIEKHENYKPLIDISIDDILSSINAKEIIRLVNELPKKASIILKLFAIEGYSHDEIAQELNITVGTSKSQLNRARMLLKQSINSL